MTLSLDGVVVVPAADPDDGERTARVLAPLLAPSSAVIVVHVVEKAGGGIDKAPVEAREDVAADIFDRMRAPLEETGATVETDVLYGTDVVEAVFDGARDRNADAVAFVPREGNRLAELLTGDVARRLVKEAAVPVVALPDTDSA